MCRSHTENIAQKKNIDELWCWNEKFSATTELSLGEAIWIEKKREWSRERASEKFWEIMLKQQDYAAVVSLECSYKLQHIVTYVYILRFLIRTFITLLDSSKFELFTLSDRYRVGIFHPSHSFTQMLRLERSSVTESFCHVQCCFDNFADKNFGDSTHRNDDILGYRTTCDGLH